MMIAIAATSARSDRASASFFLRVIVFVELFSALVSLFQSGLVYFAFALNRQFHPACMRSCYFNQAASISLVLKKVPNGLNTGWAFANLT